MTSPLASVPENDHKISSRPGKLDANSPTKIDSSRRSYAQTFEEDITLTPGNSRHIIRRRGSHLKRWIEDQQYHAHTGPNDVFVSDDADSPIPPVGTPCNPYLAYPHLGVASFHPRTLNEVGSLHNYVVVDEVTDNVVEVDGDHVSVDSEGAEHMSLPPSPALEGSPHALSSSKIHNPPSSFRNFHLFRASRTPSISVSGASSTSRNPSGLSLFRSPRPSTSTLRSVSYKHNESSSLSTLNLPPAGVQPVDGSACGTASDTPTWRWRSSVLGRFSSFSEVPQDHLLSVESQAPRLSTSSTYTYTSAITPPTTTYENEGGDLLQTSSKPVLLNSVRSRGKLSPKLFRSGPGTASVWSSGRTPAPQHMQEGSGSTLRSRSRLVHKGSAIRIPFSPKSKHVQLPSTSTTSDASPPVESEPQIPHIVYPNGKSSKSRLSLSSLSAPAREKRKKKLIVSGIERHDMRRFEAMKAWCESFGEVTQIVRVPNGDLHIHFRKAEVAETVCRVRAKVNISGVGSVHLSWFTGDKR